LPAPPAAAWGGKPAAGEDEAAPEAVPEGPAPGEDPGPAAAAAAIAPAAGLVPGALTMSVPVMPRD